jgi:hypothetical protein
VVVVVVVVVVLLVVVVVVVVVVVIVVVPAITIHGQLNSNNVIQIQFPEKFQSFKFKSSQQVTGACVKPRRKTVKYWVDLSSALGLVERRMPSNLTRQWVDKG